MQNCVFNKPIFDAETPERSTQASVLLSQWKIENFSYCVAILSGVSVVCCVKSYQEQFTNRLYRLRASSIMPLCIYAVVMHLLVLFLTGLCYV